MQGEPSAPASTTVNAVILTIRRRCRRREDKNRLVRPSRMGPIVTPSPAAVLREVEGDVGRVEGRGRSAGWRPRIGRLGRSASGMPESRPRHRASRLPRRAWVLGAASPGPCASSAVGELSVRSWRGQQRRYAADAETAHSSAARGHPRRPARGRVSSRRCRAQEHRAARQRQQVHGGLRPLLAAEHGLDELEVQPWCRCRRSSPSA